MENTSHNFRIAIFPYTSALMTFGALCISVIWIIGLLFTNLSRLNAFDAVHGTFYLFLWMTSLLICCFVASSLTALGKMKVSSEGISGNTFWGIKSTFVAWDDIETVKHIRLFGARWLRLFCKSVKRPLWIPLFLKNMSEFQKLVIHYSKEGNPIREYLDESNKYPYPGLRKYLITLITFLLIPFLIYAGTLTYYLTKAPVSKLIFHSSSSGKLLGTIPIGPIPPSLCRFYIRNFSDFDINKDYDGHRLLDDALFAYGYAEPDQRPHMLSLVEFFLRKGGIPDSLGKWGYSYLHSAVRSNSPELIRLLLRYGADVNVRADKKHNKATPLGYARSVNKKRPGTVQPEVIQLLIQNGAIE
jgi:hypothetical protein